MKEPFEENYFDGEIPHMMDDTFGYGTVIRTFSVTYIKSTPLGFEVTLTVDLDSGFELSDAKVLISHEDLTGYETSDVKKAVQYALGFFDE